MPKSPAFLEILVRVYGLLVKAYPASFRREYGDEMTFVFRDMAEAAWRRRGTAGLVGLWWRMVGDFIGNVPRQHIGETQRRIVMWQQFLGPAHFVVALAVALFIAALVTPADPASQILVGIPLYLVYLLAFLAARIRRKRNVCGCPDGKPDFDRTNALVKECFASEDYVEGRRAFMEKRRPQFKGR